MRQLGKKNRIGITVKNECKKVNDMQTRLYIFQIEIHT